jgi:integrase
VPEQANSDEREARLVAYNHEAVQAAKAISDKRTEYRIKDGSLPGLVLRVTPNGAGSWWFYYRYRLGKKWKLRKVPLGDRSRVKLADVRKRALELIQETEAGSDPVGTGQARRTAMTFRELAQRRLKDDQRISKSTRRLYGELLEGKVYKTLGDVPASEVTREMVAGVLNKIDADRQADLTKAAISSSFRWGMKRNLVRQNPVIGLGQRAPVGVRANVLTADELAKVWHAIEADDVWLSRPMRLVLKLILFTGQRRTEVVGARRQELKLDGDKPIWTIPGDTLVRGKVVEGRTKNGKEQVLPLSKQAVALFREATKLSSDPDYLFPVNIANVKVGATPKTPHMNGQSVSKAMRLLRIEKGIKDATVHDMRRSMATWMGDQGIRPDVVDLVLNHAPKAQDVTRRHYNFSRLEPMVRAALQQWGDFLEAVATGQAELRSNIVVLARA